MKLSVATSAVIFGLSQSTSAFAPSTSFAPAARGATTSLNAVSKKDSYTVTLLPGDGIGPEITAATKSVLEALCERCGFQIELKEALISFVGNLGSRNDTLRASDHLFLSDEIFTSPSLRCLSVTSRESLNTLKNIKVACDDDNDEDANGYNPTTDKNSNDANGFDVDKLSLAAVS